ncbi:MAG TPA: CDP-diacylglycerol--serine O-phosphatidyltransferase [Geothrix sp.]
MDASATPAPGSWAHLFQRSRPRRVGHFPIDAFPAIPLSAKAVQVLSGPPAFRSELLERIAGARHRIILVCLYLQDDPSGREIMEALYAAHRANPGLDIQVLVDTHRAQRGLIGKVKSPGNAAMYRDFAFRYGPGVRILGVPVQSRELFGVLHLKGFIFDDSVLYSGASLNDVYLGQGGRYRLDRYHLFESKTLADCLADFVRATFLNQAAVTSLNDPANAVAGGSSHDLRTFRRMLRTAQYTFEGGPVRHGEVAITPLAGLGAGNRLNETILALLKSAQRKLAIYTPYFNLPGEVRRVVSRQLAQGREVTIVVGDKAANDFFIPPNEPFKVIGLLPYLYEANLRRFTKAHRQAMADGRLKVYLWHHADNTFHMKGLFVDDKIAVVTGNNLNPRAWNLDLENGLVIQDPRGLLRGQHARERASILKHATRLASFQDLETPSAYPPKVQQALRPMNRTRIDRLLNRLL